MNPKFNVPQYEVVGHNVLDASSDKTHFVRTAACMRSTAVSRLPEQMLNIQMCSVSLSVVLKRTYETTERAQHVSKLITTEMHDGISRLNIVHPCTN